MWARVSTLHGDGGTDRPYSFLEKASYDPVPIGGVAVAFMLGTYGVLGLSPDLPLLVLAGCGTTLVYLVDRTFGYSPEDQYNCPGRLRWVRDHRRYLWVVGICVGLLGGAMLPFLQTATILGGLVLGGIGGAYGAPILPGGHRLKAFASVKPYLVAIPWAVGAVVLPVVEAGASITPGVVALCGYRMCWVLPNILLAEWSDRPGDALAGLPPRGGNPMQFGLREKATAWALVGFIGGVGVAGWGGAPLLLADAAGLLLLLGGIWRLRPDVHPHHMLFADLVVAWPALPTLFVWLHV